MSNLQKLQEIRERRLEKQQKAVLQCKHAMIEAEQKLQQCRINLEQYHQWRLDHQESLFKGMQGQSFSPQGMFEYRAKIEKLAQEEEQLKAIIVSAQEELKAAQEQYVQAKRIANELALKNEKTKEIVTIQEEAEKKLAQAKE